MKTPTPRKTPSPPSLRDGLPPLPEETYTLLEEAFPLYQATSDPDIPAAQLCLIKALRKEAYALGRHHSYQYALRYIFVIMVIILILILVRP